ncbi:MAG: xylose isomerase [Bacteroidetes bacterium 13_1_20CM_4_60_6]|nr:MAG: xylose isomerase [Bacteroidetes bacterium 13_1_20CM_4_60_6]
MPPTDRRTFLQTLGAAALAAGLDRAGMGVPPRPAATLDRIGLQLYTVRGALERDFEGTLDRVAAIGYREVEFAGYYGKTPHDVWAALEKRGLAAPSAHVPFEALKGNWRGALEDARVIGHRYVVVPWIPPAERRSLDGYKRVARLFNRAGAVPRELDLQFAYHNQAFEFARLGGRVPYDVLLAETDPKLVALELDLYWIRKGGGDPLAYFARYPGRFPMVHVKDMDKTRQRGMTDVGRGVIDFKRIFARRAQAGIAHWFVEHDQPADPFASIQASYDYLKRLEF